MTHTARLDLDGTVHELPVVEGTEHELAIDISKLRADTGYITLDDGYGNTGSCRSEITFIDGEQGILRYRGIPIEELAKHSSFVESAYLVMFGKLPTLQERSDFAQLLDDRAMLPESMRLHFAGFPPNGDPMAILSAMINALGVHGVRLDLDDEESLTREAAGLMSRVRTIAAAAYKSSVGEPIVYPRHDLKYAENFLHMMFSVPFRDHEPTPEAARALNLFLLLHADHEQNCSTSTVRMVASSQANLYACLAAGVCALWGPRHGGANVAAIKMLQEIEASGMSVSEYVTKVKNKESGIKLMGFGHRVYRNFDPRSRILRDALQDVLAQLDRTDPLLDIAKELEDAALSDDYFIERKLYPNVDFYSGLLLRALGIPLNMFTVMFAIGRLPGWIANWKEVNDDTSGRIYRPRQVYTGNPLTHYVPIEERS